LNKRIENEEIKRLNALCSLMLTSITHVIGKELQEGRVVKEGNVHVKNDFFVLKLENFRKLCKL
jgi:hypothetical protein